MDNNICCPRCGGLAYFNSYFSKYQCSYCFWMSEKVDKFKGNEELLDNFIDKLEAATMRRCSKKDVKESLIKLLNSL